MNEIIQSLYDRKSVRAYTDDPISEEDKALILRAAAESPTSGNQQLYTIIDIQDQSIKDKLAKSCDDQPFIAKGKMVLVFCADCLKWHDAFTYAGCEPRDLGAGDLLIAVDDALIAAQNAVVAAESLGIGSCYIGDVMENYETHREILNLPKYVFPAALLIFGYPTEQQKTRRKPSRVPMEHLVHVDRYRTMDREEIETMFAGKPSSVGPAKRSYEDWMQAYCSWKFNSDFARELTRSVERYLEDFGMTGRSEKK